MGIALTVDCECGNTTYYSEYDLETNYPKINRSGYIACEMCGRDTGYKKPRKYKGFIVNENILKDGFKLIPGTKFYINEAGLVIGNNRKPKYIKATNGRKILQVTGTCKTISVLLTKLFNICSKCGSKIREKHNKQKICSSCFDANKKERKRIMREYYHKNKKVISKRNKE